MKLNKFVNLLVVGLALTIVASGCRKKPVNTTVLPGAKVERVADDRSRSLIDEAGKFKNPQNPTDQSTAFQQNSPDAHAGWIEDAQALKTETVFFDFDSSVIRGSEKHKVTAVADYLKANAGKAVRVEGNCDERGTEEYNRSLGERRASAVRDALIGEGIAQTRVDTKSWGKDNPANDQGHDEGAWKKNRRDEFIVLTKPGA